MTKDEFQERVEDVIFARSKIKKEFAPDSGGGWQEVFHKKETPGAYIYAYWNVDQETRTKEGLLLDAHAKGHTTGTLATQLLIDERMAEQWFEQHVDEIYPKAELFLEWLQKEEDRENYTYGDDKGGRLHNNIQLRREQFAQFMNDFKEEVREIQSLMNQEKAGIDTKDRKIFRG